MSIYTRKGDYGETYALGNTKIPKDHPCVEAYGQIDELNAILGVVIAFCDDRDITIPLKQVQKELFSVGAELAANHRMQKLPKIRPLHITELEKLIDSIEKELLPLTHFILPGGSRTASLLHHARTVCRRAERRVVAFSKTKRINENIVIYLNRLSDLLFVMARLVNKKKRKEEIVWTGR